MSAHRNTFAHWAPRAVEKHPYTACGRHIDGPCDGHAATGEGCRYGLAWTRGKLEHWAHRPYMPALPACPVCADAEARAGVSPSKIKQP